MLETITENDVTSIYDARECSVVRSLVLWRCLVCTVD